MPHWSYASADLHIASLESKEPEPVASAGEPSTCLWRPPIVQALMQVGLKFIQCIGSNVMIACWAVAEACLSGSLL